MKNEKFKYYGPNIINIVQEENKNKEVLKKMKFGMDKTRLLILVLVIALVIAVGYIALGKWQVAKIKEMQQAFQVGYNRGVNDAITTLYQQTNNCQAASVTIGDAKRQLIDVACLRAG